jgi:ubiquitin-activating enzyme E1-like protein
MGFTFTTYLDIEQHLADFIGSAEGFGDRDVRFARRAIQDAYNTITNERNWIYNYRRLFVNCHAPVSNGTIQYQQSSAALPQQVTLSGGTAGVVANATNTAPIVITSQNHGLFEGQTVTITGVLGNTAANVTTTITYIDPNTFSLDGTTGNGNYTTGGTWTSTAAFPPWAAYGIFVLNNIPYEVAAYISPTVITLTDASNPGVDVGAGASYMLYQDSYPLPSDFIAFDKLVGMSNNSLPAYVHPRDWLTRQRFNQQCSLPWLYTVMQNRNNFGSLAVVFAAPPDQNYVYNSVYIKRPRPMLLDSYKVGNVSATQGSATLTGNGTAWTSNMVNSVVRLGMIGSKFTPTSIAGLYPCVLERSIVAVVNGTTLTMDTPSDQNLPGVQYVISDPVDIEQGAMTAYRRCCEWQLSITKSMKISQAAYGAWMEALALAKGADKRTNAPERAGQDQEVWRLRDFAGSDTNTTV